MSNTLLTTAILAMIGNPITTISQTRTADIDIGKSVVDFFEAPAMHNFLWSTGCAGGWARGYRVKNKSGSVNGWLIVDYTATKNNGSTTANKIAADIATATREEDDPTDCLPEGWYWIDPVDAANIIKAYLSDTAVIDLADSEQTCEWENHAWEYDRYVCGPALNVALRNYLDLDTVAITASDDDDDDDYDDDDEDDLEVTSH